MSDCIVARLSYDDVCEVFNINVNDYEYIVSEWHCKLPFKDLEGRKRGQFMDLMLTKLRNPLSLQGT
jgi:hypothetical protein